MSLALCTLCYPVCPCLGDYALLASLGTRLSCSSLIYYKGDGDKWPREPPRIQCPRGYSRSRPWRGRVTGSRGWNFCRVCFICVMCGVFFFSCSICWQGCCRQMRPRSCHGEREPAALVGARYRPLLRTSHQTGHRPGPGPLRACGLRQRHLGPGPVWCCLSLGVLPRAPATSSLDGLQDGDICPPQNFAAANT